jgi:hypothetical protein
MNSNINKGRFRWVGEGDSFPSPDFLPRGTLCLAGKKSSRGNDVQNFPLSSMVFSGSGMVEFNEILKFY